MTKISPKLISVELNRLPTDDNLFRKVNQSDDRNNNIHFTLDKDVKVYGVFVKIGTFDDKWKGGRYPTQLFCNIKNNQFKYVKHIT
jgi:hypothetical protein